MDFFEILESIMVPNRDNGRMFINTERIERIDSLLWNSKYRRVNPDGLFFLFASQPLENIAKPIVISSHIDCVCEMTKLFSREYGEDRILGTYDNAITNAAVLWLMLNDRLPENVLVAFTGDEECSSNGARQLVRYFAGKKKTPAAVVVLDVTDMGWEERSDFTIENDFWEEPLGRRVIEAAERASERWKFVPSDVDDIPEYIAPRFVIREEADEDESWEYDEQDWACFSFCLPTHGHMHSNEGVLARKSGCLKYINALADIIGDLAGKE